MPSNLAGLLGKKKALDSISERLSKDRNTRGFEMLQWLGQAEMNREETAKTSIASSALFVWR